MDWLTKLPVVGPLLTRLMDTHAWRSYETLVRVHWERLAAAITFLSFVALFPLIAVGAAVGAALLTKEQLNRAEDKIAEQVPGISDQLDLDSLVQNAGTVGLVAGVVLLYTGISWVGSVRGCLRAVWDLDEDDGENVFLRKAKDMGVLLGLGVTGLASLAASALGTLAVDRTADLLGMAEGGAASILLKAAALAVAVAADFLMLLYVLTLLPGVQPRRRRLVFAALLGAVGFELLKLLLSGYMGSVAGKSMYGAFGVPVALLLWINFTAKLTLYCASWTATEHTSEETGEPAGSDDPAGSS